jgi:IS1 family transposase
LGRVLDKLSDAKRIYTDKLRQYKTLIPAAIHRTTNRGTNHIERNNLTIRTHIKRLARRTICFSRKIAMLHSVLKIYFWG